MSPQKGRVGALDSGFPDDLGVDDAVLVRGGHQDFVGEVGAEGEVEDEVALRLAGGDTHVAQLQGLEEALVGQLRLIRGAEDRLEVLGLDGVAVEAEVLLRAGAFLLQLFGDHFADLVHQFGQETQPVVNLVHGCLVEVVMRIDTEVKFQGLAREFVFRGEIMVTPVVELDLSKVLARYLAHDFNIVLKTGPFQHCRGFIRYRPRRWTGDRYIDRMQTVAATVARAREIFDNGTTRPLAWRLEQLGSLRRMLIERRREFAAALAADLGKHETEAQLTEIGFVTAEAAHLEKHLVAWLRPRPVSVPLAVQPAKAWTELTPLGVVLVIGPWNYPLQLLLAPLAGALAAGNTVVLKPSEHAPATSAALARWIPEFLPEAVQVVEGGIPEATALLALRFDHIFFTGGEAAAKVVLRAAAEHLTPVTLELGGKSPAYVDATTDLAKAAKRIAWGRFMNAGQTCVAPDYVLARAEVLEPLQAEVIKDGTALFGSDPAASPSYARIVDDRHFARLAALADASTLVHDEPGDA